MSAHRLKADSIAKRLRRVLQSASHEYFDPLEIGGGGSHQRTRLRPLVPCSRGKYREICRFRARDSQGASAFGRKFNRLPTEFPGGQSRENLRAIREPKAPNSEADPVSGSSGFLGDPSVAFARAPRFSFKGLGSGKQAVRW